jgi:osmotically inducible lipoprotein OsmB
MRIQPVKHAALASLLAFSLGNLGCANMTSTEQRVLSGAGIGAVTGALVTGRVGGAAVGGALGAGAGWLYDRHQKRYYYHDRRGRRVYR